MVWYGLRHADRPCRKRQRPTRSFSRGAAVQRSADDHRVSRVALSAGSAVTVTREGARCEAVKALSTVSRSRRRPYSHPRVGSGPPGPAAMRGPAHGSAPPPRADTPPSVTGRRCLAAREPRWRRWQHPRCSQPSPGRTMPGDRNDGPIRGFWRSAQQQWPDLLNPETPEQFFLTTRPRRRRSFARSRWIRSRRCASTFLRLVCGSLDCPYGRATLGCVAACQGAGGKPVQAPQPD